MDKDRKAFNSSLRPISKKRQAEGKPFGLKRTRLKPISKKQTQRIKDYRKIAFARWGECCFICGVTEGLQVHHFDRRRFNNTPENLYPLCPIHHNHLGSIGLEEVNNRIKQRLKELGI